MADEPNNIQWRLQALERRMDSLEERSELLTTLRIEVREIKKDMEELVSASKLRELQEHDQRIQSERDKKADRKWQIGIAFATVSAVIAAVAIIVPILAG